MNNFFLSVIYCCIYDNDKDVIFAALIMKKKKKIHMYMALVQRSTASESANEKINKII